ncbi:hypothetical protein [Denitrobacterium detoxificans]|jgi:hypothetical protein|uniref:hypothetical protein n=1 Tax=Denitrobacterium detoxificans TaxID=79604 RepID=UPI0026EC2E3B|nr:hypothetical protein [Denitrobacterium detoxificans]MBE6465394.1 hypothetical protein [Denitrobacterium detoxificans]
MEPLLFAGDYAVIQQPIALEVGHLFLVVQESGELALHRLVALYERSLLFKGDVTGSFECRRAESVIGRLVGIQFRDGGEIVPWHYSWFEMNVLVAISRSLIVHEGDVNPICGKSRWRLFRGIVRIWGRRRRRIMVDSAFSG